MSSTRLERLVQGIARRVEGDGPSRRGFLGAATLAGAALATRPVEYLTRPVNPYASLCGTDAECADGYSAFCCSINGGRNVCPPNTYPGGWWKADRSSYCGGAARYYIDCNALPGHSFSCHCNDTNCDHRRVACNWFRYGQCNTQIRGVTPVVCRQISCRPPWEIHPNCGHSSATDDNTAGHTAPCLNHDNTYPPLVTFPVAPHLLYGRHSLSAGQRLTSYNRHTTAVFWADGNFDVMNQYGAVWRSGTAGKADGGRVTIWRDGELAIYSRTGAKVWSVARASAGSNWRLNMRDDGQLVIENGLDPTQVHWSTHTHTS